MQFFIISNIKIVKSWRMSCVSWIVCLLLTFIIPLRLTYKSVKENKETKLWGIYWGFYTLIGGLFWLLPFLEE